MTKYLDNLNAILLGSFAGYASDSALAKQVAFFLLKEVDHV